jgi:hypothetical protein
MLIYKDNRKGILRSRLKHTNHYLSDVIVIIVNTNIKWGKGGEFRQILRKKKKNYLLSKGYTCRFKSETFASFASIPLRQSHVKTSKVWTSLMKQLFGAKCHNS